MDDLIRRQAALDAIMGQPPEPHYPSWYAAQIEELPAVQLDHIADIGKKVEQTGETAQNVQNEDLISRKWLMECIEEGWVKFDTAKDCNRMMHLVRDIAPSVQPEQNAQDEDLISKKAAIEAIEKAKMAQTPDGEIYVAKYNAEMNIQLLPTVQPVLTCDGCQHNGYFKHDICRRCLRNVRDLYGPE